MKFLDLFKRQASPFTAQRAPLAAALEPRMLFDGAIAATAVEAASSAESQPNAASADDTAQHASDAVPPAATSDQRQEVVFIDGKVDNKQQLIAGLKSGTEVVVLDSSQDGLQQIADYLQGREGIDAIHILSHGAEGQLHLGSITLDQANLASRASELAAIGRSLSDDGDILLYGCDVARGGDSFISQLATLTGADVAASDDATGAALRGGDWVLEAHAGAIDTDALLLSDYQGLLAIPGDGSYPFAGATDQGNGTYLTADGFFVISALDGNGNDHFVKADQYGAFINENLDNTSGTSYIQVQVAGGGSFQLNNATIGDYHPSGAGAGANATQFFDVYAVGYASGVPVAETPEHSSIDAYQTNYNLDFSSFSGVTIDTVRVYYSWSAGNTRQIYFNLENLTIAGASNTPADPPAGTSNQPPTLSAVGQNPDLQENASAPVDLFRNVIVSAVEGAQNIDRITLTVAGLANGAEETLRIDGSNIALIDGTSVTSGLGLEVTVSVSGGTATVTLAKTGGISAVQAQEVVDGLGYRNTADINADSTRTVTLTGIRDTGGTADGGVDSTALSIVSTVDLKHDDGSSTNGELIDVLQNHNLSNFANGFTLATSDALGSADDPLGIYLNSGTSGWFEVSANDVDIRTFDLTAITLAKFSAPGTFTITITGIKSDGSADVTTSITSADGSTSFTGGDFSSFTGLSKFRIDITANGPTNQNVSFITFDSFHISGVVAPQDAPVLSGLDGDSVGFTEGGAPVLLDAGSNATVTDSDSPNFDGGNVTVSIVSNGVGTEDELSIRNQGADDGQIGVSGSVITYDGTQIGTFAGGTGGNNLVITLNANATPDATQALIHNLTYSNNNGSDPSSTARTVRITVSDGGGGTSSSADVTVNITPVNDPPTASATALAPTFTEGGSAVAVFSNTSISTVEAGQTITGLGLTVSNLADGSNEILRIDGTDITLTDGSNGTTVNNGITYSVSLVGGTATVTLSKAGGVSATAAQTLVDGISYRNSSESPGTTSRVVTITEITDSGGNNSTTAPNIASTVTVIAVNDAPTLSGGPYSLTGTDEDTSSSGTLVSTILANLSHSDLDAGAVSGIAITASVGNGTWQYSTDGNTWDTVGTVNNNAALLLSSNTQLRYVPNGANGETATLTFRAWDQTSGNASTNDTRNTANTSISGGSTAFSSGTAMASMTVASVNDAPVLSVASPTLPDLTDDAINNNGVLVSSLYASNYTDVDTGAFKGIAITSLSSGNGSWQYSLDGTTWNNVGVVTASTALLLRSSDHVRFVPDGINGTTANFTFRAWDQTGTTAGLQGTKVDASAAGGTTAFSSGLDTASVTVTAVNDTPVVTVPVSISVTEDVSGALTGISFSDVDAGSASVTATFSVPSGTLSATDASGVTVAGSGTGSLSLSGSLSDINAFIATASVKFQTALDNTNSVLLTVSINDNGNTGGSAQSDTKTVIINVSAVNDAPINSIPAAQSVDQDVNLVFNSGNGNLISISDVDAGSNAVRVTLTASNGLLTLGGTSGLVFSVGSGTGDATMTFDGSLSDINNALNGLTFNPTGGYNGSASLQITTNDLGNSGGGVQTDTDTINITVNSLNPRVTDVSASTANGTYKVGDIITITTTFSEAVTVDTTGGTPGLLLETGSIDRMATYVSGSGSNTLTFSYTVQAGDRSADLDYQSSTALALNGATIANGQANAAIVSLPTPGSTGSLGANASIVIDTIAPTVNSATFPVNGTYVAGQALDFRFNFTEALIVDTSGNTPYLEINIGGQIRHAEYFSGSSTSTLVFRYIVQSGDSDSDGIAMSDNVRFTGDSIRDAAGNPLDPRFTAGATPGIQVDALAPEVTDITLDGPAGPDTLAFTVTFSENVSGVTANDFSLLTTGSASGTLNSITQISPNTYRITVDSIAGQGNLGLTLNVANSNIVDSHGNALAVSFSTPGYAVGTPTTPSTAPSGDPQLMAYPPVTPPTPATGLLLPDVPAPHTADTTSPLLPAPLFELRTLGSGIPTLGNIFINNGALAPSFIAQVFASSDSSSGSGTGFLGFGGGEGGVFGSSTLAGIFSSAVPESGSLQVFGGQSGSDVSQGLRGVFGAPTLGQQLHDLNQGEQRQLRELALALSQFEFTEPNA